MAPRTLDAERLATSCARHLGGAVSVDGLRRLSGGASRESWSFDAVVDGGTRHGLVLRRDPGSTYGSSDRSTEYRLLEAAAAVGVPVPTVRFLLDADDDLGDGFVMDRIEGETIPRRILRDDEFADARPRLAEQCGTIAAQIHAVDVAALPRLAVQGPLEQIEQYRGILDTLGEPHPAFELGLRWLEEHAPATGSGAEPQLVHGDFRNGNFIVGPEGIRAVLDWELSHLGDPVEDLGWLCVKSWRFGVLDQPVGGFGSTAMLLDAYAAAGGGDVAPEHLRYWETFGTLKWGVICEMQCFTHLQGLVRSVELAALGRRIAETEWDLLELIGMTLHDRPSATELVAAVREYLERDVMTATEGRVAFHARVAVNVLGMVERELELGAAQDAEEHDRLFALLGRDGSVRDLTELLASGIRDGTLDASWSDTVATVRESVRAKLEVANPRYLDAKERT